VKDDGKEKRKWGRGTGLAGMEERVRMVGGRLRVERTRNGVRLLASVPSSPPF